MSERTNQGSGDPRYQQPQGWQGTNWGGPSQAGGQQPPGSSQAALSGVNEPVRPGERESALTRFLGGSPIGVFFRLLIISLAVGALLMWLNIHPLDILYGVERFFRRVWMMGFDALREMFTYVLAGAVIVIPVWLLMRIFSSGNRR